MSNPDIYRTIKKSVQGETYKEKGSKFLAFAYPVSNEAQIKKYIDSLHEEHHKARHWCYAWRLGIENYTYRINDDGEPKNSAGNPIFGQIVSKDLTNVLVVVVRYFGGIKLGVGGLINAYRSATVFALEKSDIIQKTNNVIFDLIFDYVNMDKIMRVIKERKVQILNQEMNLNCKMRITFRKREEESIKNIFKSLRCVNITIIQ